MKKALYCIGAAAIVCWILYSSSMKIQGYLVGIFNEAPDNIHALSVYEKTLKDTERDLPNMTFEDFKRYEKTRLHYEIKAVQAAKRVAEKLDDAGQLGK